MTLSKTAPGCGAGPYRVAALASKRGPIVVQRPELAGMLLRSVIELLLIAPVFVFVCVVLRAMDPQTMSPRDAHFFAVLTLICWGVVQLRDSDAGRSYAQHRDRIRALFRAGRADAARFEAERVLRSAVARWWSRRDFARARYGYATLWLVAGDARAFQELTRRPLADDHGLWAACLCDDVLAWRRAIDATAERKRSVPWLLFGLAAGRERGWSTEGRLGDDASIDAELTRELRGWCERQACWQGPLDPWATQLAAVALRWLDAREATVGLDSLRARVGALASFGTMAFPA